MIQDRNIVCIASNWFYDPTSKHHVMRELSRCNHVVWVNYHGSRRPQATKADVRAAAAKLRQFISGPQRVSESMKVLTPLIAPFPGNRAAAALNRRLLVRQIRRVLVGLPNRPVQLWLFAPDADYLIGSFDEEAVVYYCVDEFSQFAGYDRKAILAAEARTAARADLVVTTSRQLYESKRGLGANTILVPHGVDAAHFARAMQVRAVGAEALPVEVRSLPRPVLGFWGMIEDWVDVALLAAVARARPMWSIVLIGEEKTDVNKLRGMTNVHLLGRRSYAALPDYAATMNVGMIPFRVNALTAAVNPIKLREYLAAGLPVVSTDLPEVRGYADHASIASTPEEFVAACERAMANDSVRAQTARHEAMQRETWPAKVVLISGELERIVRGRAYSPRS